MTKKSIDQLISLTKKKKQLLDNIINITKRQTGQIEKENMEGLDMSLNKKDNIIKQIDKLDREFLEVFSQVKKAHSVEDINQLDIEEYPNLKELKEVVQEVASTLLAISMIDKENSYSIKRKLEKTKLELRNIKKGKKAYKGYNTKTTESMLIDEKK
ncbi:flagellar protein FlgN [Schnuerera sp. xch1]|uniref:flagellar export chaperone FlgN n=1 Tax=Schnuerera sp. xch1 TaxID=2874283 RepID=UPI001CC1AF8A|nr:flagellar export chaperone FlgN [Schnuerera sp. xch1]MBZ2174863.1 flagellar protein FlgN [Schnuerera sp. xch1]